MRGNHAVVTHRLRHTGNAVRLSTGVGNLFLVSKKTEHHANECDKAT